MDDKRNKPLQTDETTKPAENSEQSGDLAIKDAAAISNGEGDRTDTPEMFDLDNGKNK